MRKIYLIHQWVSLICALFLLLLTLTGLPLLFRSEINAWNTLNLPPRGEEMSMEEVWRALPEGEAAVAHAYPDKTIRAVTPDASDGTLYFLVQTPGVELPRAHMRMGGEQIMYDVRTGTVFNRTERTYRSETLRTFMHQMHVLHSNMGMGASGRHFLALMCILSVISIVSGFYLYLPMMKNLAFGARRRESSRLFWSDWHKIVSVFAAAWTVMMCVSGVFIVLYSMGMRDYHRSAHMAAAEHFAAADTGTALPASEALAQVQGVFPRKDVISLRLPSGENGFYTFQIADPSVRPTDFAVGQQVYLPVGGGEPLLVPVPTWLTMAQFFLNVHIHNHHLFGVKLFWAFLIVMTAAMIVTGVLLWLTRWRNYLPVASEEDLGQRTTAVWEEPARVIIVSMIIFIAPLYGRIGDTIAFALGAYLVVYFVNALRR